MINLVVVNGGVGTPSASRLLGERLAEATVASLAADDGPPVVDQIELRTLAVDLAHYFNTHVIGAKLRAAFDAVRRADGVIAVTPVFNGAYSGLFKLFFDALDESTMKGRPVLLAATGGTPRHSLAIDHAMLPLFFYLKALIAPDPVFAATKDWGSTESRLPDRIRRAAQGFARLVETGSPAKDTGEFEVTDFEQLLESGGL